MKKYKMFGFTLSEVLIAVAVAGVIAALTIPNVVNDRRKQSYLIGLKKIYSDMQQNLTALQTENYHNKGLSNSKLYNQEGIKEFFNDYYQVKKECEDTAQPCFADKYKNLEGRTQATKFVCNGQNFLLKSGAAICINPPANTSNPIVVCVDINGRNNPNTWGRDAFRFNIYEDFSLDEAPPNTIEKGISVAYRDNLFNRYCRSGFLGTGCFAKILNDNWKMNY